MQLTEPANNSMSLPRAESEPLSRGLWISLAVHVGILALFLLKMVIAPSVEPALPPAIRVDIVALPEKNQQLPPPLTEKPDGKKPEPVAAKPEPPPPPAEAAKHEPLPKKTAPVKKDEINLKKTKTQQNEAFNKLKSLNAFDKIKKDLNKEQNAKEQERLSKIAAEAKAKAGEAKVRGNIIAPGTELTGVYRLQHEDYRNTLDRHIKPYWQAPEWLAKKGYRAQVIVRVNLQGQIISKKLVRSSGNPDFDASVLETVDRATPLPAPPEALSALVSADGIIIQFGDEGSSP